MTELENALIAFSNALEAQGIAEQKHAHALWHPDLDAAAKASSAADAAWRALYTPGTDWSLDLWIQACPDPYGQFVRDGRVAFSALGVKLDDLRRRAELETFDPR